MPPSASNSRNFTKHNFMLTLQGRYWDHRVNLSALLGLLLTRLLLYRLPFTVYIKETLDMANTWQILDLNILTKYSLKMSTWLCKVAWKELILVLQVYSDSSNHICYDQWAVIPNITWEADRGVPVIGTADMLIYTASVIGTDNQRSRYKCRYSTCKINFYLTHAKEHIATKSCWMVS